MSQTAKISVNRTREIVWYNRVVVQPLGPKALKDDRGNIGDVEVRVRVYLHATDGYTQADAVREESHRFSDDDLIAAAKKRGKGTWDEDDLWAAVDARIGERVL